jgi:signal transduction histidine kinase
VSALTSSSAAAASEPSVSEVRGLHWWHAAFVAVPAVTALVNIVSGDGSATWSTVFIAAITVSWFLFGRLSFAHRRTGIAFSALIVVLMTAAIAVGPNCGVLQSLIYPFVWSIATTLRQAVIANVIVAVCVAFGYLLWFGTSPEAVFTTLMIAVLSLLFSLAFGIWISRIAEWGEHRSRLLADLTAAQDQLAAAHRDAGVIAERARLSREVHDTLAQSLTGLVMLGQRATATAAADRPDLASLRSQLELIESVASEALAEARAVVADSAPVSLDGGLAVAVERLAERFERETGVEVLTAVDAVMSREHEVVLLRCAQEGLANVRKHADAGRARVTIDRIEGVVRLAVTDDGRGITAEQAESSSGFGLSGMRERLALVDGAVTVRATEPHGTELVVEVPSAVLR